MTTDTLDHAEQLFLEAVARPLAARTAWLRAVCAGQPALREAVEALLAADAVAADFLEVEPGHAAHALSQDDGAPEPDLCGGRAGAWQLRERLGSGGMGVVYVGEHGARRAAVKVLRDRRGGALGRARFAREVRALARLDHPGIARLLDHGAADGGRPYLALELVAGARIDEFCAARALDLDARGALFAAVCAAVVHAHAAGVVHRDLKPANVLVRDDGQPVVLDFGIATLAPRTGSATPEAATVPGGVPFTAGFASPEQLRGVDATAASDQYALGLLLRLLAHGAADPRIAALHRVAAVALAVDPRDRFASVGVLAARVAEALVARPGVLARRLAVFRVARSVRRRPLWWLGAVVAFAVTAFALSIRADSARARQELSATRVELARARWQAQSNAEFYRALTTTPHPGGAMGPGLVERLQQLAAEQEVEVSAEAPALAALRCEVADSLEQAGATTAAAAVLGPVLDWQREVLGAGHRVTLATARRRTGLLLRSGQLEAALVGMAEHAAALRAALGPGASRTRAAERELQRLTPRAPR